MEQLLFTDESLKVFTIEGLEDTIDTHDRLYLADRSQSKSARIVELKGDIARYVLVLIDCGSVEYVPHRVKQVNLRIAELCQLGCREAVEKFLIQGRWT